MSGELAFTKIRVIACCAYDWPANALATLFGRKHWLSEFRISKAEIS